jgi:WD40 repeat protein
MYHKQGIEISPLQAYASALIFSPAGSLIRHNFKKEKPNWITIKPTIGDKWSACLQTLEGHGHFINSVTFSHDSTRLALGSDDRTVRIWDAGSGECLQTLEGHSDTVNSVAFSHNSTRLASGSDDRTVRIWDTGSGECLQTLEGHNNFVSSVAFSHDLTRLASGSWDRTVRIWDAGSGECLQTLEGHSHTVYSVAFSHDSTRLTSGSWDRTVRIWDAGSGDCMQILNVNRAPLNISFDTTGSYLHTDYGTVAVDALSVLDRTPDTIARQDPRYQGVGLSPNRDWITYNSEYLVWLPSDYRPGCSAVSGRTIGIGVGSGKVWICNLNVTGFEHY